MFLEIRCESVQRPAAFEAKAVHVLLCLFLGCSTKIHLIERGNQSSPVPPNVTMKINRAKALVTENAQGPINVLF